MSRLFKKKGTNEHGDPAATAPKIKSKPNPPPPPPKTKKSNNGQAADSSLLSNLSPTSYAKQFDDLDQVVALASPPGRKNKQPVDLSKQMDGLSLGGGVHESVRPDDDLLDFDEDDAVFEDDDSMADAEEEKRKASKTPERPIRTDRSRSHVRDRRRVVESPPHDTGDEGSSSSSSMGNYDNASVGTTESEDEEVKKGGHGSDSAEDYTDDEDEGEDGYKVGGYHPVKIGEVYNQR